MKKSRQFDKWDRICHKEFVGKSLAMIILVLDLLKG